MKEKTQTYENEQTTKTSVQLCDRIAQKNSTRLIAVSADPRDLEQLLTIYILASADYKTETKGLFKVMKSAETAATDEIAKNEMQQ